MRPGVLRSRWLARGPSSCASGWAACSAARSSAAISASKSSPPRCVSPWVESTLNTQAPSRAPVRPRAAELEDADVEGAAAQVVHGHGAGLLLVQAVGDGRRGGLVDDAH